jgi:hypothetical protein
MSWPEKARAASPGVRCFGARLARALPGASICAMTLTSLLASTASARAPAHAAPGRLATLPGQSSPRIPGTFEGSNSPVVYYNWSGYAATAGEPFLAVQSSFVQPAVSCPVAGAWTLFWVGFDGFQNNTVEQAGTAAYCRSSNVQPDYYAWWEMYPTNAIQVMPLTIKAGDKIHAQASYLPSSASYSLMVTDTTTKQHYKEVARCAANLTCPRASADWIVERPTRGDGSYTPLANWSTIKLGGDRAATTTAVVNGKSTTKRVYQPVSAFSNTPLDMVDDPYTGEMLAMVGDLNSAGTAFADTWLAAE